MRLTSLDHTMMLTVAAPGTGLAIILDGHA